MASKELLEMLNQGIARELQVVVQYMWQHVQWIGIKGAVVRDTFQETAIAEMKHAEKIAERLFYIGDSKVLPTTKPSPINVGTTVEEMIKNDVKAEQEAVELYKKIVKKALAEDDETTANLFRGILADEEDHLDTFTTLLEGE